MFHPRLIAVVTALVLLGGTGSSRADYDLSQLQAIEGLISSRNCEGLWLYVKSNPGIIAGADPLANELRTFVAATERGQLNCFASRTPSGAPIPGALAVVPAVVPGAVPGAVPAAPPASAPTPPVDQFYR
jgi:hypothetical protein